MPVFKPAALRGDQRLLFLGQTGSGKSVLARFLLRLARKHGWRVLIVDPKRDWMKYLGVKYQFAEKGLGTINEPRLVKDFNPKYGCQIIQPLEWDAQCERVFKAVIATGNTIVYVDEITSLATATVVPHEIKLIWQQGRALNVGGWCSTQRPKGIPTIIKDQSEVWFMFRVNNKDDRKVTEGYLPLEDTPEVVAKPLPRYWFFYWEDSMPKPMLVKPLRLEEKVA